MFSASATVHVTLTPRPSFAAARVAPDDGRGAGHVALHVPHARAGLDVDAAGVERDALADERDVLRRPLGAVGEADEARLGRGAAADGEDAAVAARRERLGGEDLDLEAGGRGGLLDLDGERGRAQQVRGRVGPVLDDRDALGEHRRLGHGRLARAVDRHGLRGGVAACFALVAVELVGAQGRTGGGGLGVALEGDGGAVLAERGAHGGAGGAAQGLVVQVLGVAEADREHELRGEAVGGGQAGERGGAAGVAEGRQLLGEAPAEGGVDARRGSRGARVRPHRRRRRRRALRLQRPRCRRSALRR